MKRIDKTGNVPSVEMLPDPNTGGVGNFHYGIDTNRARSVAR
ncbi:hypothetical protein [Arachidicoccus sp.]